MLRTIDAAETSTGLKLRFARRRFHVIALRVYRLSPHHGRATPNTEKKRFPHRASVPSVSNLILRLHVADIVPYTRDNSN